MKLKGRNKLTIVATFLGVVFLLSCIRNIVMEMLHPFKLEQAQVIHRQMLQLVSHMQRAEHRVPSHLQNRPNNSGRPWGYHARDDAFLAAVKYLIHARHNMTLWRDLDLMKLQVPQPLSEFTSPCWWVHNVTQNHCPWGMEPSRAPLAEIASRKGSGETRVLRCLPYFYIIGQGKSGTTDLFNRLTKHPDVAPHAMKETQWVCRARLRESCSSFETYLNLLQKSANFIQKKHKHNTVNPYITSDATPGYFSYIDFWDMLPGNEGCTEPCVTNADIIHHLNPRAKIILSLRNPTDRLYSYYFFKSAILGRMVSKQDFHDLVNREIGKFNNCLASQSLRGCCYNYTIANSLTEELDLRRGIYHVFLMDWMKVFPSNQIHVQTFEDYTSNETKHLAEIFNFLNLKSLPDAALSKITTLKTAGPRKYGRTVGDMMAGTRVTLDRFYKPHNEELATLMGKDYW
ncbi:carbohydrate sulfotransferase 15-like [Haliotis rufescens]|uniref:carbohydrate sulfotransferase 15-like n=1 Tax=Haliotis rufescens TaxID=6454 RepID=UPI00201F6249|nr:carbohydrate sulfotransferase 15-like [Haliotis rufescens]